MKIEFICTCNGAAWTGLKITDFKDKDDARFWQKKIQELFDNA
jgi:hypothetical protein